MKRFNYVDKGASRYVVAKAEQFDQKNEMFNRPLWDSKMLDLGRKLDEELMPENKPGYGLQDYALMNAAWHLEHGFAKGIYGGKVGLYAWDWGGFLSNPRMKSGLTISIDDLVKLTKSVKRRSNTP